MLECKRYQWCESETNILISGQKTMKKVRVWVMKFFSSESPDVKTFIASPLMKKRCCGSQVDSLFDQRSRHFFWVGQPDNQGWQLSLRSKLKLISSQNILGTFDTGTSSFLFQIKNVCMTFANLSHMCPEVLTRNFIALWHYWFSWICTVLKRQRRRQEGWIAQ